MKSQGWGRGIEWFLEKKKSIGRICPQDTLGILYFARIFSPFIPCLESICNKFYEYSWFSQMVTILPCVFLVKFKIFD